MRIVLLALILISFSFPQNSNSVDPQIKLFFEKIIINDDFDLSSFIHKDELIKSNRLGISYEGITNKALISFDVDNNVKDLIKNGKAEYILNKILQDKEYSIYKFTVASINYEKIFYFRNNKFISPLSYHTKDWVVKISDYFKFIISDENYFNDYSISKLDMFAEKILELLNVSDERKGLLKKEKIIYIVCKDEAEIEKVTGFNTRGIFILASDAVVTRFNCHFHELAHLLINYKLKHLPLFTLPLLQEGFAVASGGRGGISKDILLNIGKFLEESGFISIKNILTYKDFTGQDASITYPLSGIYNLFLMSTLKMEQYLSIYKNLSGTSDYVNRLSLFEIKLPHYQKFISYLKKHKNESSIKLSVPDNNFNTIFKEENIIIKESNIFYQFNLKENVFLSTENNIKNYESNKFNELFPASEYLGEKYLITINKREINIYNLYLDILIDSYSSGFTSDLKPVPSEDGCFIFYIKKNLFEEELTSLIPKLK